MNIGYKGIANYYRISISDVFNIFTLKDPKYIFIDVRNPSEWEKGIIPGALRISLDTLPEKIKDLEIEQHYIMVCHYGGRASIAAKMLGDHGFLNIYNFQGGMIDWKSKNYPLEFISLKTNRDTVLGDLLNNGII